jgi:PAS domain S-box-containing protein
MRLKYFTICFALSILPGIIFWILDGVINYYFFHENLKFLLLDGPQTLLDSIILQVSPRELISRSTFFISCILAGLLMAIFIIREKEKDGALKKSHEELKSAEEKFSKVFFSSPAWMIITLLETGKILDVNNAFLKATGYTRNDVVGGTDQDIKLWKDIQYRDKLASGAGRQGVTRNLEVEIFDKNAEIISTLCSGEILTIDGQKCLLIAALDLSEIKRLENQLQQNQKMESIGTLAGGIAHDFNNILFPILGYTEMLIEDIPEDNPVRDNLNEILTGALRAKELVKQILTFSRQEKAEFKLLKMQSIVKETLKLIRSTIPTTIGIKQDIQADCGLIKADPTQIHQIIMNLTTNAYHAMEDTGGELKVTLKEVELEKDDLANPGMEPGMYAFLTISDQGAGMDRDLIKKIFDPFFTTKGKEKGTGMGLSVVHGIVKTMKGEIQVYSEPGIGTEFKIYFPMEKHSFSKKNHEKNHGNENEIAVQGGREKILLVDDEESILIMEKSLLMRLGYQVTSYGSSLEALEYFRSNPAQFDLVISDMAMPGLPGDKLSVELLKISPDTPILLCTGFSDGLSEEKTASLGIRGFLIKPIAMKDLARKIREVLKKSPDPVGPAV